MVVMRAREQPGGLLNGCASRPTDARSNEVQQQTKKLPNATLQKAPLQFSELMACAPQCDYLVHGPIDDPSTLFSLVAS